MPHSSLPSDATHPGHASDHFDHLCAAQTLRSILTHYRRLCTALDLRPARFPDFYPRLKASLQSWKAQGLLAKFDKRASHKCYNQGYACVDTKVLVIGAGPCGLRAAIEAQLLGAKVVVLEKRDRFSRNNVLHLWPMVIHDLKALGAKKFFGKFCAGAIDHISIRQLQCILLKVALLLGVEVHENVGFEELIEPSDEQTGWRARLSPPDHPAANFQFDVLIGADGKRNTFKCFRRKEFRGKLAIAITANFVNRHTEAEARVDEISGVAFIFNQKFFKDLSAATGIDLENIVYYKDETHYFVMTAKKHSLLAKGVILQDYMDTGQLLSPSNIDRARLMDFAREAADFSTDFQLPELNFAVNHYGLEDLAMFDFTCMYASCYASTAIVRHGHGLLLQLVGDSLLEPFWPTGSGCARGFLSCFDAGWQIRSWANPRVSTLECLAERESTYRLLAQTTPKNLSSDLGGYSLDPRTRYPNLNLQSVLPHQVRHMVDTDSPECLAAEAALAAAVSAVQTGQPELPSHKRPYRPIEPTALLRWCRRRLQVEAADLSDAFQSGELICGLLRLYRPELLQPCSVPSEPLDRWRLALRLLSSQLPVPHGLTAELLAEGEADPEELLEFLSRVYDALHGAPPAPAPPRPAWLMEMVRGEDGSPQRASPIRHTPEGRQTANGDTMRRYRKRKNDAAHQKTSRMTPEVKKNAKQAEPELSKKEQFASKVKDLEAKFSGTYQPPDKKPKPVSRVIGRIEKDWNLQQIEKKIEENSRPFVNRDKDYPVPRWNRDAFDDKFQTIQSLSGGDVIPFRRFDYGQRGSNHVSAMAARFGNSHRPAAAAPAQGAGAAAHEPCHFCGQRVFLVDRMVAQGKCFHPRCFRCEYCSVTLKPGNYEYDADAGRFFCVPHFGLHSLVKYKYQQSEATTTVPPCPSPVTEQMRSHLSLRGVTPERAEFENSVCDPMSEDELLSEIDEDEWTDRNFLTTEEVLSGADCSDSDSCSPDSDQFEPALDDEEVLRLAERWRRLHDQPEPERRPPDNEPDSDRYESDGVERAGDASDTGHQSETEEEVSERLRRRAEDGLTEHVLRSNSPRKRTNGQGPQVSGPERISLSRRSAGDSSSAASDTEIELRPPLPPAAAPRIVVQDTERPPDPDPELPELRPEPIGAERDSHGSGSGSGSGKRQSSQERKTADVGRGGEKEKGKQMSPRKDIGKKITGSIPVLKKPVSSLIGRGVGKPAVGKTVTTARVSVSTLVQQKPNKTTSATSEDAAAKPTRDIRRNSAQRSRPPASDSAAWRNSAELKRRSLVSSPSSAPAAVSPARSRSAADLGSRIGAATGRVNQGQQATKNAANEGTRKPAATRQSSAEVTRPSATKIPTRPQPAPRASITNGAPRPVAARRTSPPERKTSAPAKLTTEKSEGAVEQPNLKAETGKLGKSAPIRRGSGGNRVAAIAARDRVRRQVKENLMKQRMARKAREEANKSNGRRSGAQRRRSQEVEGTSDAARSDNVDVGSTRKESESRVSSEDWDDGEKRRRRGSSGRDDEVMSGSSEGRDASYRRTRKNRSDKLSSPDKLSSSAEADSASEAISGCETSVEVRLPGPDDDAAMHSSEEESTHSEREVRGNHESDGQASAVESGSKVKREHSRDSRHSQEHIPKNLSDLDVRDPVGDDVDDIHLSLSGAEEFDDVALEQRWRQMLGDDDELMETENIYSKPERSLGTPPNAEEARPLKVSADYQHQSDTESEGEVSPAAPSEPEDQQERSGEGDTFLEFDALLNDVDVTNLERGFDNICDDDDYDEELSEEDESSGRENVTITEVTANGKEQTDDEASSAELDRRDSPSDKDHYSSHHSDAASDLSDVDSYTDHAEELYDRPSTDRNLYPPGSPEHAEDAAWVTADSTALDSREAPESGDEETAWQTAESTSLDTTPAEVPRNESGLRPEECALPPDEESMSEEDEEGPARKALSGHEDVSSSDQEDRILRSERGEEQASGITSEAVSKKSPQFKLDESFITFRRRRRASPPPRKASPASRDSSPDAIEIHEEAPSQTASPTASPPPIIDLTQDSPEPEGSERKVVTDPERIEASMEFNQQWVDEWREVDETVSGWMSEARREQRREAQAPEERRETQAMEERRGSHGLEKERSQTPEERKSAQMPEKWTTQTPEEQREAESPEGRRETQVQLEQRSPTPERRRTQTPEDLSIEMEPDVEEVIVTETRTVMSEEPDVRPTAAEVTMDEDESVSWEDMVTTADEMSSDGGSKVDDDKPHEQLKAGEVTESKGSETQHNVVSDEVSNIPAKKERMNLLPYKFNENDAVSPLSTSAEDSPKHDVSPELRLFGGDETTEIVSSRKRSSDKNANSKLPSLRDRITSAENEAVITTAKSRETKPARDSVRTEPIASARSKAKIPDQPSTKGPGATSTPLASSRPPLTSLPTPITNTEQTPEPPVSSALYRLIQQTPNTEQSPVWEWETPPIPRPPPSTRPPPIPVSELEPQPSPGPPPVSVGAPEKKGVTQPLPALSAPAAVLAATAIGAPSAPVPVATPTTSPVTVPVATPVAPVPAVRSSARISPSTSTQVSATSVPTVTLASSAASRVSSAPQAAPAVPTPDAVPPGPPDFPLRSAYVNAAVQKTRPAPVRVSPLARIWPPVSSTEAVSSPSWLTSKVTPTVITAPLVTSAVPGSPIPPVSPTSPTTRTTPAVVSSRAKPTRPTLPALPLSSTTSDTGRNVRPAPRSTAVTTSRFASTTPAAFPSPTVSLSSSTPVSPIVHSTPSSPAAPPIPVPPSTPTSPSAPVAPLVRPPRAAQIRVSPLVEEVSARLLRRGATEPSLVLPPRSALSGAPMRLSRLPEDLAQTTPQEPAQERPPEESLIRDLVLSRVRRSPEKQIRKRVTSPALLGTSGPSVRPLPPPVPKSDVEEDGEAEEEGEVIPPPPLTATRRLMPPPPPPIPTSEEATQSEASGVTEKTKPDVGAEQAQAAKHNIIDFSPVVPFIDDSPSSMQEDETKTTPSTTHEPVSENKPADEPPHQPERVDQPPPLPDKTRGSARLSLIPAAARALFSPPRRPPRASDQRTPRRKKQSAADRKAVLSMPPDVGGTMVITGEELRPVSDLHGSLESETSALGVSSRLESPSTTKKAQSADLKSMAASPNRKTASSTPALTAVSSTDTTPAVSAADLSNPKLSPERDTSSPNGKPHPSQPSIASPGSVDSGGISPPKDESSDLLSTSGTGEPAEPSTQEQTQETAPDGKDGKTSGSRVVLTEPATPTTRKKKESSDLKKKRERRRSIIQTISDMFRHSTDKKEKDKEKDDGPDSSPPSKKEVAAAVAPSPPSATDVSASPSPLAVAAGVKQTPLRNRLGLRFRKSKDKDKKLSASPSLSPPGTPVSADVTDSPSITDAVQRSQAAPEAKVTPSGRSSPEGTLSRRSRSGRAARHSEIRRQQRAQELQRQLGEVEVRQQELQLCADELEKTIRGETSDGCGELTDDAALMRDWFALVHERSLLVRRDQLLQLQLQELQLEDRHDRLQLELRERMASPEPQKSAEDIERERELVNTLLEISDQRRALRQAMDAEHDALRAECESAEARQQLLAAPPAPVLLEESTV